MTHATILNVDLESHQFFKTFTSTYKNKQLVNHYDNMEYNKISLSEIKNIEFAWNKFLITKEIDDNLVRKEIALSWMRCFSKNISPYIINKQKITNNKTNSIFQQELTSIASKHIDNLYNSLRGKEFIIFLTDENGAISRIIGERKMLIHAEALSLTVGENISEEFIGTTSSGISIKRKIPFQVFMFENYCQVFHSLCCTSSPIINENGTLTGSICVGSKNFHDHDKQLLGHLQSITNSITLEFKYKRTINSSNRSKIFLNSVLNYNTDPIIIFNDQNKIEIYNNSASSIITNIGIPSFEKAIDTKINKILSKNNNTSNTILFKINDGKYIHDFDATIIKIKDNNANTLGSIARLSKQNTAIDSLVNCRYTFDDFVHQSQLASVLISQAKKISTTDFNVLIEGESGTGKELISQSIHNYSNRNKCPFIAINCANLPKDLIQSELFGYDEGSFTGANRNGKKGKFELADGGTLFLDEIGDMPMDAQASILRVLQENCITRVGSARSIPINVRVIAATNKNLLKEIKFGNFRQDLYFRLSVTKLHIPPLRNRINDINILIRRFANKHNLQFKTKTLEEILAFINSEFENYDWPGNVRELENIIICFINDLPHDTTNADNNEENNLNTEIINDYISMKSHEYKIINDTLIKNNNNLSKSAKELKIGRSTLYRKLKKIRQQY